LENAMLDLIYGSSVLVSPASVIESGYIDIREFNELRFGKYSTGGNYQLEFEWSNDGIVPLIYENVNIVNNMAQMHPVVAYFLNVRIRNTDPANPFITHTTFINGFK
jgi:hypothetical protein